MTYEVQQTRWDRLIRRVSGSIGPGSRVSETISELFPVLDVESVPGELLFLSGTKLGWGGAVVTSGAGDAPGVQLFNPAGSGHLVTVESVLISSGQTNSVSVGITTVAFPINTGLGFLRDVRTGQQVLTVAELRTDTTAIATLNIRLRVLANTLHQIEPPNSVGVLAPGTGMSVVNGSNNTILECSFFWRERPAEESELQF